MTRRLAGRAARLPPRITSLPGRQADEVLDLFCGAVGGWSIGLHAAGYRTVAAAEIDPWRRQMFSDEFPEAIVYEDVRQVTAESLRERLGRLPGVVVGSPPCLDFSPANHEARGVDGDSGALVLEWARLVREIRPCWAACETGPRLLGSGSDRITEELEGEGYAVWSHGMGARDLGARHHRSRAWLIAADPYRIDLRQQPRRQGWAGGPEEIELVERHQGDPDADEDHEHGQPVDGKVARLVGAVDAVLGRGWVRGAGRLLGLLGLAHGAEPGMARALAAAVGDAVMPQITEAIGRTMKELTENAS